MYALGLAWSSRIPRAEEVPDGLLAVPVVGVADASDDALAARS